MSKRITIPEGSAAIVLPTEQIAELKKLMQGLRQPRRKLSTALNLVNVQLLASNVLLAILDGEENV